MKGLQRIILTSLPLFLLLSCSEKELELQPQNTPYCIDKNFKQDVEIVQVKMQPVTEGIHLTGAVETNPDKVIHFVSLVGGIISKVNFSLGDEVVEGQVLAELQSKQLSSLESKLKNLDSQIQVAEKKLQTMQSMFDDGISTKRDLLKARSKLEILESDKQKVTSNLDLFSASAEMGVFQIKAPHTGIVTAKSISAGTQILAEGEPLFTISDLSVVWVMADIYATNVQNIKSGMDVNITTLSYPDTIFRGKIDVISQVLDSEAKTLKARITMPNKSLKLKPGMWVDVIALKNQDIEAIGIPTKSMVFDDNQNFVVTHKSDCEMEIRKIEILSANNGTTFIASGLKEDEKIITRNQLLIYEQIKN